MSGDVNKKLGITVEATDLASGKLGKVKSEVAGIGQAGRVAGGPLGALAGHANRAGNALGTLKGRVTGLAGAIGPLVGVGGLLGVTSLLAKSITEANAFGENVRIVAKTTGLAVGTASSMVDTLDKWGVSSDRLLPLLGKLEKNLGGIAEKKDGLADFGKQFGFTLTDNNGKILDANALLLKSADYWNGNATASEKALLMSKLWGKQWQDMVPILSKGSAFIKAQEADSIHLTDTQLANMAKFRDAQRDFQDTFGDIEVKGGAELMPILTLGMTAVSGWLDSHGDEIARFFHDAAAMAGQAASGIIGVFGAIQAGWNTIPEPLRNALVTGFVANKAIKFLFGFDPAGALIGGVEKAITGAVAGGMAKGAIAAGIGKLFVQPVFVTNPGFGAGGAAGLAGAAEGTIGGLGLVGVGILGAVAGIEVGLAELIRRQLHPTTSGDLIQNFTPQEAADYHSGKRSVEQIEADRAVADKAAAQAATEAAGGMDRLNAQNALAAAGIHNLAGAMGVAATALGDTSWLHKLQASWQKAGATMHEKIAGALADLAAGKNVHGAATFIGQKFGRSGFGSGGYDQALAAIATLKGLGSKDPAVARAIARLTAELPRLKTDKADMAAAMKIAQSDQPKAQQLTALEKIMDDLRKHGDPTTRAKLQGIIDAVKAKKLSLKLQGPTAKAFAETHVRIFENGDLTSDTHSSTASSDPRWGGFTSGLARGGRVPVGRPYWVGEEGPELRFDTAGQSYVMDHARSAAYSGGGSSGAGDIERLAARIEASVERLARFPRPAYVTARQAEGATARQRAYGPTRARQLSFAG